MDKKGKEFKVINPTSICGDGSCGCGCGVPMETREDLFQEESQEARTSSKDRSLDIPPTSKEEPVKK
jgi:hypothetical protein